MSSQFNNQSANTLNQSYPDPVQRKVQEQYAQAQNAGYGGVAVAKDKPSSEVLFTAMVERFGGVEHHMGRIEDAINRLVGHQAEATPPETPQPPSPRHHADNLNLLLLGLQRAESRLRRAAERIESFV